MAKRSSIQSEDITDFLEELDEIEVIATGSEPELVYVRSLIPARVVWRSPETGEDYLWENSGSEVKVRKEDVTFLLNHRRKGCCGEASQPQFELVD